MIIISAFTLGALIQWRNQNLFLKNIESVSSIICDLVSTRAQGGSTRDVYDQVFSFLRSAAPDPKAQVIIKNGNKFTGPEPDAKSIAKTCSIPGLSDYEIKTYYHLPTFFSAELLKFSAYSFLTLLLIFSLTLKFLKTLRSLWFDQILTEINKKLGLIDDNLISSSPKKRSFISFPSEYFSKIFLPSVNNIKPSIDELKLKLDQKNKELQTSQKLLDDYELQTRKAEEFSEVVKHVRHDLKGPLSILKFAASPKANQTESREALQSSIASIEKIMGSLDKVKQLSIGQEQVTFELLEVAIQDCINEKISAAQALQGININFYFDESCLNPVVCEPHLLRRVISNLLQNALEASPKGSLIELKIFKDASGNPIFEIKDQGSGIDLSIQEKLFQKNITHGKLKGTGLGLYFVKQNIISWGGDINFKTSNQGTTFKISLIKASVPAHYRIDISPKTKAKIAILDDEIEIHELIWNNLDNKPKLFKSAHEFMEWLENDPNADDYTLMIDLHLNDFITGVDVLRTIDKRANTILSTSDYFNPEALELTQVLGFPICPKSLLLTRATP